MSNPIVELEEEFEKQELGGHFCSIYRDKEEQLSVVVSFMRVGLKNNDKCVFVLDESTKEEIVQAFKRSNIDVALHIK
ncbi:MAG: MEDS domain-containing protein [Methanobacteriota archaeon]